MGGRTGGRSLKVMSPLEVRVALGCGFISRREPMATAGKQPG